MIKTKINEATFVNALSKAAQTVPASRKKSKNQEIKPSENKPEVKADIKPEQKNSTNIPSDWKAEIGTEIELNGVKYKANTKGGWLPNGIGLPIPKTSSTFSTLNLLAYNKEQNITNTSTPTTTATVPLGPEDAETEESTPSEEEQIDYNKLYNKIYEFEVSEPNQIEPFVTATISELKNNQLFKQAHEKIAQEITRASTEIFNEFKFIKDVEGASKFIAGIFMENRKKQPLVEAIDPNVGLAILAGVFAFGGGLTLNKYFKKKALTQDFEKTIEAQYIKKLGLLLVVKFIDSFIYDSKSINNYINEASYDIEYYMKQFKKSRPIPFRQTKLFKEVGNELTQQANDLYNRIAFLSNEKKSNLNESTIKRWKLLAGIGG